MSLLQFYDLQVCMGDFDFALDLEKRFVSLLYCDYLNKMFHFCEIISIDKVNPESSIHL